MGDQPSVFESKYDRSFGARWARWVLRWRLPVLLASVVGVAAAGSGVGKLKFASNYRVFFAPDNPEMMDYDAFQDVYGKTDNLLFLTESRESIFTPEVLGVVHELTQAGWRIPYATRVESLTNFQHTRAEGDELVVQDLVPDPAALTPEDLEEIRRVAFSDPALVNRIVSPSGRTTAVDVLVPLPDGNETALLAAVDSARALVEAVEARHPGIRIRLTGGAVHNHAFMESGQNDAKTLIPLMYLAIIVLALVLLRTLAGTFGLVVVVALSSLAAMGLAGHLGLPLEPVSASASTMVLTLAVADCVHVVTTTRAWLGSLPKREAIVRSLAVNFGPVFLTSLTTTIGFLSMNFSESPPFRRLGNITAMGIAAAFVLAVTFLPALMSLFPLRPAAASKRESRWPDRLADLVVRFRRPILVGAAAVIAGSALLIPRNELNDDFVEYFDSSTAFRQNTAYAIENGIGFYNLEYSLAAGSANGISDPAFLRKVEDFAGWYRQQPEVLSVVSIADVMKRLNRNMHGDSAPYYRIPESRELAAQYLLLYEMSLPYGLDLNNQIDIDKSAARFTVITNPITAREIREFGARADRWLADRGFSGGQARASSQALTGPAAMFARISQHNIQGMLTGTLLGILLVSACLIVAFRSLRLGLISLLPNLGPAVVAFGIWGVLIGQVGMFSSTVTAMTFGIVVDNTVHLLSKFLYARRALGASPQDAVRHAYKVVGPALLVSNVVLVVGFAILAASSFEVNAQMGLLSALTIAIALVFDLLVLPPLLLALEGRSAAVEVREPSPAPAGA